MKKKALLSLTVLLSVFYTVATDNNSELPSEDSIPINDVALCKAPSAQVANPSLTSYFSGLFSTENWPARWSCGDWSQTEGWLYISSDLSIFLAYLSIPIMLLWFIRKQQIGNLKWLIALFGAFILLCGFTHLIDVVLFWEPMYRLSGFTKLLTGVVSLATATVLGFVIPKALEYKSPDILQAEINERKKIQNQFETFVKFSPGAIAMLDTDMKYVLANDGWYKDYGLEGQEIIGKSHYEIFPQIKEMPEWLEHHRRVLNGERLSSSLDSFENNGSMTYLRWKLEPWYSSDEEIGGLIMFTEIVTEEVLKEKQLKESETRFANIFNKAQFGIALVGSDRIPFLVNDQLCELLGFSEEELTSKSFAEFTHPEDATRDAKLYAQLLKGEIDSYTIDKRYIASDGKTKYVKLNVTLVDEGTQEKYSLALIEDMTDRKLALKKKKQSDRRVQEMNEIFSEISSMANIGSWEVDLAKSKCEWSDTVYQIHELDNSVEIKLEDGINFYHPDYQEIIQEAIERAISKNESWDLELKIITAKGNERWVRAVGRPVFNNGEVVKLQGLFQDIHEKVEAQKQLLEKAEGLKILNQRFDLAQKAATLGIWDWYVQENLLTWDDFMYKIYGIGKEDFSSCYEAWQQGIHPEDKERSDEEVQESLEKNKKFDTQFRIVWPNGEIRYIKALGEVFRDDAGSPIRMIGVNWDITEEVLRDQKITELNKTLQSKVDERTLDLQIANEELESFSYSVSHDLRAPLRAINGYSEALLEDYSKSLPEDATQYMSRIAANSLKMGKLIDDLLEFSRMNRKEVNHVEINTTKLIDRIIDDLFKDSRSVIEIDELPKIYGDKEMLAQVFSNLIGNAIKYSSRNENQKVVISSNEEDGAWIISIKDNGVGFNMAYSDKLFQVFQRLHSDAEFEGTGVGLSLCGKIMKAHDGEIWAEAEEGKGATFYLKFKKSNA